MCVSSSTPTPKRLALLLFILPVAPPFQSSLFWSLLCFVLFSSAHDAASDCASVRRPRFAFPSLCLDCPYLVFNLAHALQALLGDADRLLDDGLGHGERGLAGGVSAAVGAVGLAVAVGRGGGGGGGGCLGGGFLDVVEDAPQEGGEGEDLARAEELQGVVLYGGGPVGRVGVEGVEEALLYSRQGGAEVTRG